MQRLKREAAQRGKRTLLLSQLPEREAAFLATQPFEFIETIRDKAGADVFSAFTSLPLPETIDGFSRVARSENDDKQRLLEKILVEVRKLVGDYWVRVDEGPFYRVNSDACYTLLRFVGRFSTDLEVVSVAFDHGLYMTTYTGSLDEAKRTNDDGLVYEMISWQR